MFSRGEMMESEKYNQAWSGYMNQQFQAPQYQAQQTNFNVRNKRMNEAISHKQCKMAMRSVP